VVSHLSLEFIHIWEYIWYLHSYKFESYHSKLQYYNELGRRSG
jgi:hypothetical protein